jgi:hypothetical protein
LFLYKIFFLPWANNAIISIYLVKVFIWNRDIGILYTTLILCRRCVDCVACLIWIKWVNYAVWQIVIYKLLQFDLRVV